MKLTPSAAILSRAIHARASAAQPLTTPTPRWCRPARTITPRARIAFGAEKVNSVTDESLRAELFATTSGEVPQRRRLKNDD